MTSERDGTAPASWLVPAAPWLALFVVGGVVVIGLIDFPFAMDEIEFFRATRWVAQGKIPYRDFWEHHFPLHWYFMTPLASLAQEASASSLLVFRGGQALLWVGTAALTLLIQREWRRPFGASATALTLLFACYSFSRDIIEFRIDGSMNLLFFLAVYVAERSLARGETPSFLSSLALGALLALAGLSSQRMAPAAVFTGLVYLFTRPGGERWGFEKTRLPLVFGGLLVAAGSVAALGLLGALPALLEGNWTANVLYERLPQEIPLPSSWFWLFQPALYRRDLPALLLALLVLGGTARAVQELPRSTPELRIALFAAFQLLFLSCISSPFPYQFHTFFWLASLLSGLTLGRLHEKLAQRPALAGALLLVPAGIAIIYAAVKPAPWLLYRRYQAHQDAVLKRVERVTTFSESVLDGSGYGVNRRPAFKYWFLPRLVRVLTQHGILPALSAERLLQDPPGALVVDSRLVAYTAITGLQPFLARNYLPLDEAVWVPAPSGRLAPGQSAEWRVLRAGAYRATVSARYAAHPWFREPFSFGYIKEGPAERFRVPVDLVGGDGAGAGAVTFALDGQPLGLTGGSAARLARGQRLTATNVSGKVQAVFVTPEGAALFFDRPFWPLGFEWSLEL